MSKKKQEGGDNRYYPIIRQLRYQLIDALFLLFFPIFYYYYPITPRSGEQGPFLIAFVIIIIIRTSTHDSKRQGAQRALGVG